MKNAQIHFSNPSNGPLQSWKAAACVNPSTIIMLLSDRPVFILKDDGNDVQAYIDVDKEKKNGLHDHIFIENNASVH